MGEPRLVITGSGCAAANVDDPCHHDRIWRAMQSTSDIDIDTEMARQRRGAARFFWMWLIVATAMSVTGNVAHAVLHADSRIVALAALVTRWCCWPPRIRSPFWCAPQPVDSRIGARC